MIRKTCIKMKEIEAKKFVVRIYERRAVKYLSYAAKPTMQAEIINYASEIKS